MSAFPLHDTTAALAAALAALATATQPRVLAHGVAGSWDEVIVIGLVLVIIGAIWIFVRAGGDAPSEPAADTEQPGTVGREEEGR